MENINIERRIQREISQVKKSSEEGIYILSDIKERPIRCAVDGPANSPYSGGYYEFNIHLSENHPFQPPKVYAVKNIWHANISQSSKIVCVSITEPNKWNPCQSIRTILQSLRSLLSMPNFGDAYNGECSKLYKENRTAYNNRIKNEIVLSSNSTYIELKK